LGVAFDPHFNLNHFIYLYYTVPGTPAHNRVSRFTANGDVVLSGSGRVILELNSLSTATNHNGGAVHFGADGKLYIAVGDNANGSNAQNLSNLLGKILRLNSDGTVPSDNPFAQSTTARHEIWALGLRNPFTFAFRGATNFMYINDVGQATWEEINQSSGPTNYLGWPKSCNTIYSDWGGRNYKSNCSTKPTNSEWIELHFSILVRWRRHKSRD